MDEGRKFAEHVRYGNKKNKLVISVQKYLKQLDIL